MSNGMSTVSVRGVAAVLWRVRERVLSVWASEGEFSTQESMTSSVCVFMVGVKMNWEKETDGKMISLAGVLYFDQRPNHFACASKELLCSTQTTRRCWTLMPESFSVPASYPLGRSSALCLKQYKITLNWEMIRFLTKVLMDESQRLRNDELPVDMWKQLWWFYSKIIWRHSGVIWL